LNKLSISAKDLLEIIIHNILARTFILELLLVCLTGFISLFLSPVILTMAKSAPHVLSNTVTPTKCFDTTDGTVTLNFDRTLLAGETLKISLVNTVTGGSYSS
jgi:hypothetical protein